MNIQTIRGEKKRSTLTVVKFPNKIATPDRCQWERDPWDVHTEMTEDRTKSDVENTWPETNQRDLKLDRHKRQKIRCLEVKF